MDAIRAARMLAAAAVLLLPLSARAAVFVALVGDDPACGYRTSVLPNALQSAIDAVPTTVPPGDFHVVHVARSGSYVGTRVLVEDRSLRIEGGYATCASALPGGTNTTIDATGAIGGPVRVRGTTERETVYLAKLTLRGGSGSTGSGISIRNATVSLERVIPTGNSALRGGGIELEGTGLGATVVANGTTRVIANTATQEGGGISCTRGGLMQLASSTEVSGNAAATSGGGIFADGCAGYANVLARSNSSAYGGFLFTRSGLGPTTLTLGLGLGPDDPTPALLTNEASVGGGAIFASGDDTVISSVSYSLSANVERLVLTGGATLGAGNAADNTLDGGQGADTLAGGAGNDTYRVDTAGDTVTDEASAVEALGLKPLLVAGGFLYVEGPAPLAAPPEGLRLHRERRGQGQAHQRQALQKSFHRGSPSCREPAPGSRPAIVLHFRDGCVAMGREAGHHAKIRAWPLKTTSATSNPASTPT